MNSQFNIVQDNVHATGLRAGVDYKKHRKLQSTNEIQLFGSREDGSFNPAVSGPSGRNLIPISPKGLG